MSVSSLPGYKDFKLGTLSMPGSPPSPPSGASGGVAYKTVGGAGSGEPDSDEETLIGSKKTGVERKEIEGIHGVFVLLFWYINLLFSVFVGLGSVYIYIHAIRGNSVTKSLLYSIGTLIFFSFLSTFATLTLLISNHLVIMRIGVDGKKKKTAANLLMEKVGMGAIWFAFVGQVIALIGLLMDTSELVSYTCYGDNNTDCVLTNGTVAGVSVTTLIVSFLSALFTINIFSICIGACRKRNASKKAKRATRLPEPQPFSSAFAQDLDESRLYQEGGVGVSDTRVEERESYLMQR